VRIVLAQIDLRVGGIVIVSDRKCRPEAERLFADMERQPLIGFFYSGGSGEIRSWAQVHRARNLPEQAPDSPDNDPAVLILLRPCLMRPCHEVRYFECPLAVRPYRYHSRAIPEITLFSGCRNGESKMPVTSPLGIDQSPEYTRAVVIRQTHPVDCAIRRDQRRRPPVTRDGMIRDGWIDDEG
jgi:hypothetical protein